MDSVVFLGANQTPTPTVAIVDANGNQVTSFGGSGGSGGSLSDILLTDTTGALFIARDTGAGSIAFEAIATGLPYIPSGTIAVSDNKQAASIIAALQATLNIQAAALPLPAGAAKDASLASILAALQATQTVQATTLPLPTGAAKDSSLQSIVTALGLALPLPSGAAKDASLTIIAASLASLVAAGQDIATSGNITVINAQPTGVGTAGSYVGFTSLSGRGSITFQITGTYTGALTPEVCQDGVNWIPLGATGVENVNTGAYSASIASGLTGMFTVNVTGCNAFRLTALSAVTGTAVVTMQGNLTAQMVSLDNPLPPGSNAIGTVGLGAGTQTIGQLTANQSVNLTQNGGAVLAQPVTPNSHAAVPTFNVGPANNVDKASAALTTSGNSGVIAEDFGQAAGFLINVTAVSGTTPTLDLALQESFDNGVTFQDSYHVMRLTAAGTYNVPNMTIGGRRQWKWTVGGTSPSFTTSINAMRSSFSPLLVRQFYDRTLAAAQPLNANPYNGTATAGSVTATFNIEGCKSVSMQVSSGLVTTTASSIQMQFSVDGVQWFNATAAPTLSVSNQNVAVPSIAGLQAKFVRGSATTAGVSQVINYVSFFGTN